MHDGQPNRETEALRNIQTRIMDALDGQHGKDPQSISELRGVLQSILREIECLTGRLADRVTTEAEESSYRVALGWSHEFPHSYSYFSDLRRAENAYRQQLEVARRFYKGAVGLEVEDTERSALGGAKYGAPGYGWELRHTRFFGHTSESHRGPLLCAVALQDLTYSEVPPLSLD